MSCRDMTLSSMFSRPLLIYDDKCSSCTKFAKTANILSRGWIRTAGHYYSQEAIKATKLVFPPNFDATKMFWLINKDGAYGARSGLLPVIKEILSGNFKQLRKKEEEEKQDDYINACEYNGQVSCMSTTIGTIKRILNMMRNGRRFYFYS
jgi:hypothetical protein